MADNKDFKPPADPPSYDASTNNAATPPPRPRPVLRTPLPLQLPLLNDLRTKRVILASASPRRKALLAQIGLNNIEIRPSNTPETLPHSLGPLEYVLRTAEQKCRAVYEASLPREENEYTTTDNNNTPDTTAQRNTEEPAVVIAADTVVVLPHSSTSLSLAAASANGTGSAAGGGVANFTILEKPSSEKHHTAMLRALRDSGTHKVYTAVVAMSPLRSARDPGYALNSYVEETGIRFHADLSDEEIAAYVGTREGADKAGGYAVQGLGGLLLVEAVEGKVDNVIGLPVRRMLEVVERCLREADDEGVDFVNEFGDREGGEGDGDGEEG